MRLLVVEDGHVERAGPAEALLATLPRGTPVTDHRGKLLMPGFVDAHIHYAQTDVIASGGAAGLRPGDPRVLLASRLHLHPIRPSRPSPRA